MAKPNCMIEDGLGPFLRQEREARHIPLADVSKQTRVRNFYLERIEAGEYRHLPSIPVGRGFVRAYAAAIGVDADAAARQFDREFGTAKEREKEVERSGEKIAFSQIAQASPGHRLWLPFAAAGALIVVSGVALWASMGKTDRYVPVSSLTERLRAAAGPMMKQMPLLLSPSGGMAPKPEARKAPAVPAPKREEEPRSALPARPREILSASVAKPNGNNGLGVPLSVPETARAGDETPEREEGATPPVGSAAPGIAVADGRLALKIRALEDTWVRIVVDRNEIQEFLLTAGNERFWKGSERFILTVGNAAGTQVSLNGSSIALPQSSSNIVRDFVITEKLLN